MRGMRIFFAKTVHPVRARKPRLNHAAGASVKGGKGMLDKLSLVLVIVGAINWALIGIFQFDLVAWLFGGQAAVVSRIVYTLVGAAGLWCITLLFSERVVARE